MDSPPQLSLLATAFDTLLSLSQSSDGLRPRRDGHELLSEHDRVRCLASPGRLLAPTLIDVSNQDND